jgi:UDP-N-acetyl-D-glucosamine dehydrogenase
LTTRETVAVVGLGYVGLPLALLADERGYKTIGVDVSTDKIALLKKGQSYIDDVTPAHIKQSSANFTADINDAKDATVFIVCVPTPVTDKRMPDLGPLKGAIQAVAPLLKPGVMVVVESTINPGVCDDVVIPLIKELTSLSAEKDIDLVHCPERINPGDPKWNVRNINRVLGGSSERALERGLKFYRSLIDAEIKPMQSLKEAEAVKVVENSFRDINIAFVNELAMAFDTIGIDVEHVIEGAATKPFAFIPHHPGCGVGGHCIPVDPYYLIEYSMAHGFEHRFLRLARNINEHMPRFTVERLEEAVKTLKLKEPIKVGLLGLSYKSDVGDDRESPAYDIKKHLIETDFEVKVFDPYLPAKSDVKSLAEALEFADAIVIAAGHEEFKKLQPEELTKHGVTIIVDGRNILRERKQAFKDAKLYYVGIGQR